MAQKASAIAKHTQRMRHLLKFRRNFSTMAGKHATAQRPLLLPVVQLQPTSRQRAAQDPAAHHSTNFAGLLLEIGLNLVDTLLLMQPNKKLIAVDTFWVDEAEFNHARIAEIWHNEIVAAIK